MRVIVGLRGPKGPMVWLIDLISGHVEQLPPGADEGYDNPYWWDWGGETLGRDRLALDLCRHLWGMPGIRDGHDLALRPWLEFQAPFGFVTTDTALLAIVTRSR